MDNRYLIVGPLGRGGMAEVYLAHDRVSKRDIAIKLLKRQYAEEEEFAERFRREFQAAASLSHPNIVPVLGQGELEDGRPYMTMEYLPGGTLAERVREAGHLPPRVALAVGLQVAEALSAAHERGIVHRDVKSHNILLTESGDVKVADFGIARAAAATTLTRTGFILGSAPYMSPEQVLGERVDHRTDLYSLGIVLYETLTGTLPYEAEAPIAVAMKHVNGRPRPLRKVNPEVPKRVDSLVLRMMAKAPGDRPQNATELISAFDTELKVLGGAPRAREVLRERQRSPGNDVVTDKRGETAAGGRTAQGHASGENRGEHTLQQADRGGNPAPNREEMRRFSPRRSWGGLPRWLVVAVILFALAILILLQEPSETSSVPNVYGFEAPRARETLEGEGFLVSGLDMRNSSQTSGTVLLTDPPAGAETERGDSITLVVSTGSP